MQKAACCTVALASLFLAVGPSGQAQSQRARPSLSYEFFKDKVEPVFLKKREGHARCYACHSTNNAPFHVVKLSPGAAT